MSEPKRVQRKRTKGWRMPHGAVYVGRPSRWGNPYERADYEPYYFSEVIPDHMVSDFRGWIEGRWPGPAAYPAPTVDDIKSSLRGRVLACWCPLDQPCHADVLIELLSR